MPEGSLDGQPGGYRLTVRPGAVDAVRFEQLLEQARGGADTQRAPLLREAVDLWRGTIMQDVALPDSAAFDAVIARFEGLRLAAIEDRYEAEIRLGGGPELVAELTEQVARHPVRERLVVALMRALAAAARGTEALTVYQRAREALADTLGVDPSPEMSALHVALLRGEVGAREDDRRTNLRAELTEFVGKFGDIAVVRELIAEHRLTTLTGPGGSGKPALRWSPRGLCSTTSPMARGWWNWRRSVSAVTWPDRRRPRSDCVTRCSAVHRRRNRSTYPLLGFIGALERLLQGPDAVLTAFEPLLADEDPWVRALARLQLGKMRIMLGLTGSEADAYLEAALTEFRAIGERWGISFALTELADRCAMRGEFATACELFDQATAALTEVGAIDDLVRIRARQAQLYWLRGDAEAAATTMAEAQRCADQAAWPGSLAELALAQAELARWKGDVEQAYRHIDVATTMLGTDAHQPNVSAVLHDLRGYLAADIDEARAQHTAAFHAASAAGHAPLIAQILVGVAALALRADHDEQAARLLAACAGVRGLTDRSHPDIARIEQQALGRLGEARFTAVTRQGAQANWHELATAALAS